MTMGIPILSRYFKRNHKQIVVLLGAGAAIPWGGISSQDIMDNLRSNESCQTKDGKPLGQFFYDILKNFYDGHESSFNFETFLATIEEILSYVLASTNLNGTSANTHFTPAILQLKEEIASLLKDEVEERRMYCRELFSHYINIIIKKIDLYNEKILTENHEEINENLVKFTKYFLKRNYAVKFYTTNYDNIIPQVLSKHFKVYEGFYNSSDEQKRFNYDLSLFRKACISHFNIHGSIFLGKRILDTGYETLYDTRGYGMGLDGLTEDSGNPGDLLSFTPIITGYKKTQRISNKPFNLGFHALANDCNDCKALVTVGYSFSDLHINSILSTFTKWDKTVFMDVNPVFESGRIDHFITRIGVKKEDSQWLHDDTNRKHAYKAGIEEFLKDSSNWKYLLRK
jgi:hypothetical protein